MRLLSGLGQVLFVRQAVITRPFHLRLPAHCSLVKPDGVLEEPQYNDHFTAVVQGIVLVIRSVAKILQNPILIFFPLAMC